MKSHAALLSLFLSLLVTLAARGQATDDYPLGPDSRPQPGVPGADCGWV
ncbi:MAG TPA: hypothetical protein VNO70_04580 [Blastocatellia bacterium]|nr:hypothetical protein [Blastocatellia bacterium]